MFIKNFHSETQRKMLLIRFNKKGKSWGYLDVTLTRSLLNSVSLASKSWLTVATTVLDAWDNQKKKKKRQCSKINEINHPLFYIVHWQSRNTIGITWKCIQRSKQNTGCHLREYKLEPRVYKHYISINLDSKE